MAISFDVQSGVITGIFDGASDEDIKRLLSNLNAVSSDSIRHPLLIPQILLSQLIIYYNQMWRDLGSQLWDMERRVSITRGEVDTDPWSWEYDKIRNITKAVHYLKTGMTYSERRLSFALNLARSLQQNADTAIAHLKINNPKSVDVITDMLKEKLQNYIWSLENQVHQMTCMQARSQGLLNIVSHPQGRHILKRGQWR